VAVIVSEPLASDDFVTLAVPPRRVVVPNTVVPDVNVTDPVGIVEVDEVTDAVNLTLLR